MSASHHADNPLTTHLFKTHFFPFPDYTDAKYSFNTTLNHSTNVLISDWKVFTTYLEPEFQNTTLPASGKPGKIK